MFGRGTADNGFSIFAFLAAIKNLQDQDLPHPRISLVLETDAESGSPNILQNLDEASDLVYAPDYVINLNSGCYDYENLWITTSYRGMLTFDLKVEAAKEAYHSGEFGGMIPDSFRVMRHLLSRIDNGETGMPCEEFIVEVPEEKIVEAETMTNMLNDVMYRRYPI
jgi:acetylornithine deacetylase/succinyl-diaminopimelate desuccinylase-like protein